MPMKMATEESNIETQFSINKDLSSEEEKRTLYRKKLNKFN